MSGGETKVAAAIELERLKQNKVVETLNQECQRAVATIIEDQNRRGILISGITGTRLAKAHESRGEGIITSQIELRRASIREVPELASDEWLTKLLTELERTADLVSTSSLQQISARLGRGPVEFSDASMLPHEMAVRLKAFARREVEILKQEIKMMLASPLPESGMKSRVVRINGVFRHPVNTAFDTYVVGKKVGEGGSGAVYEATNLAGELVALKCMKPNLATTKRQRFKNEVLFGQHHRHRNIVAVIDSGAASDGDNTIPFYVMPHYAKTLRHLIEEGIPVGDVLPLFSQLLNGVEAAHMLGVNHRDLKPENVLYDKDSRTLVVADFGAAQFTEDELYTVVETKPGERIANFQYAAPEQKIRGGAVDQRADIFALGLILNEMFTREVPSGTNPRLIATASPEHGYLDDLVELMRRQLPADRPSTIESVKRQIAGRAGEYIEFQKLNALKSSVVSATSPNIPPPVRVIDVPDFQGNDLVFTLEPSPSPYWIEAFKNPGRYRSLVGRGPDLFRFVSNQAIIQTSVNEVESTVKCFVEYVKAANLALPDILERKARQQDAAERDRIRREIADAEAKKEVLRRARQALA